jgi:4-amino-4-deoxy-L-arabinose transferase-like glycosyltransferase
MTLSSRTAPLGLVLLCLVLYLPGLTALPPFDQDEALFAQASKQMIETGDFIQIRFQDAARNRKPALSYWLQAASAMLAGVPDAIWPYRIPSILGLIAATLLTYWGGLRLFEWRIATLAAALFATSIMAIVQAHMARADAVLIPMVVAAQVALGLIYASARLERFVPGAPPTLTLPRKGGGNRKSNGLSFLTPSPSTGEGWGGGGPQAPTLPSTRPLWLIFWIAQSLAILTKGPVLALTSVLTIAALVAADRDWRWLKQLRVLPGIAIAILIAAPWFIATDRVSGGDFIADAVSVDLLPKLLGVDEQHGGPPGYYLATGMIMGWPATLLLGLAVPFAWRNRTHPVVRFCLAWIVPTWIFYELMPTKLPHYTLPTYPACAMLMAAALAAVPERLMSGRKPWSTLLWGGVAIGCGAFALAVPLILDNRVTLWAVVAAICALGSLVAVRYAWQQRWASAFAAALAGALLWSSAMLQFVLPETKAMWLSQRVAEAVSRVTPRADLPVAVSGYAEPSLVFLLGTNTRLVDGAGAADHIADHRGAIAAVSEDSFAAFAARLAERDVVARDLDKVAGFDYVWGVFRTLTLYSAVPRVE